MRMLVCNWKDLAHPAAGGAEVFTDEITRRWAAQGHDVTLFTAAVPGRCSREVRDGVEILRRGSRLSVYREARHFYERQARGRFDVVIDEVNTRPFGASTWDGEARVVGLIYQLAREVWFYETPLPVALAGRYWLEPRWLRAFRDVCTLTISRSSRDSLQQAGLRDVVVLPTGCDVPPRDGVVKEARPTVMFVGRLARNKRPGHALAAFEQVRAVLPDAQMWIIGAGPCEAALRRHAGPGVTFFGRVSHVEKLDLMARAHVQVVTSAREGWGLVVDEAAACATPTIAYDVPGLRDSTPAASGVLVRPNPRALAAELECRLPGWTGAPRTRGWRGGARPWDEVATAALDHIASAASGDAGHVGTRLI